MTRLSVKLQVGYVGGQSFTDDFEVADPVFV